MSFSIEKQLNIYFGDICDDYYMLPLTIRREKIACFVEKEPIIIYDNNNFTNTIVETKYKNIVEDFIKIYDEKFTNIIKIEKEEVIRLLLPK